MNNREPNTFSNIEQNIHNIISETIQNYLSGNSSYTPPDTSSSNNIHQQLINTARDVIRLGNRSLENYNRIMMEHSRNTREITTLLNRLIDMTDNRPINRERNLYNTTIPLNRRSRTQPRTQPQPQPRPIRFRQVNPHQTRATPTLSTPTEINSIFTHGLFPTINANNFANLFENVPVFPTPAELENASETVFYDGSMEIINDRCPITLATFQPGDRLRRILYCHHTFTEDAFIRWFQENVCCPVCRFDVRTYNSSISGNNEDANNEDANNEDENNDGYITPIGTTTDSYTFTDASTNNHSGSYPPLPRPPPSTSSLSSTIESMLQSAIVDSSDNIVNNLTQYLTLLSNVDSSNNVQHPLVSFQMYAVDSSNNSLPL